MRNQMILIVITFAHFVLLNIWLYIVHWPSKSELSLSVCMHVRSCNTLSLSPSRLRPLTLTALNSNDDDGDDDNILWL